MRLISARLKARPFPPCGLPYAHISLPLGRHCEEQRDAAIQEASVSSKLVKAMRQIMAFWVAAKLRSSQ